MEILSAVLQTVRLTGGVVLEAHFTAPWCVSSQFTAEDCRPYLTDPVEVIAYHYVVCGRCWLLAAGDEPMELRSGEAVLLPRNDPHLMASSIGLQAVNSHDLMQPGEAGGLARIVHGGGGEPTDIVCGFLGSDQRGNPLIATLPRVLKVDMAESGSDEWIESCLKFALRGLREGSIGASTVMSRLSELMFVEAVRRYAAALPAQETGWLAGIRDQYVGKALALIHGKPDHPWTAESLAQEVSLSRSAFSDRFTTFIGVPPKRYLISWRLQVAKEMLREGRKPIPQIAHAVGYEAEAAFNRAFKREFGAPPATWRRQARPMEVRTSVTSR